MDENPAPVALDASRRIARVKGNLSTTETVPADLTAAIARALNGRAASEFITKQGVRFAVGEKTDLDDPRFAATRGDDRLWTPATFAINSGFGIYFLDRYDPAKTPAICIHSAARSPQDWRFAMQELDRKTYQP